MKDLQLWPDVTGYHDARRQPVHLLERELSHGSDPRHIYGTAQVGRLGTYWVPQTPLTVADIEWACTRTEGHVRVPLFSYLTSQSKPTHLCFGGVLCRNAVLSLLARCDRRPLVMVQVCSDRVYPETLQGKPIDRFYLGLAFEVESDYQT